jgi:hypothetical protein
MKLRPVEHVIFEAIVIGTLNVGLLSLLNKIPSLNTTSLFVKLFLGGALIHIIFEYSGANQWWCETTYR